MENYVKKMMESKLYTEMTDAQIAVKWYTPPTEKTSACVTSTCLRTLSCVLITTLAWSVANTITFSHVTMLVNPVVAHSSSTMVH